MVGKTTMRYLDDIPSTPSKGDVLVIGEELKIYNGEEWVTISGGSDDTYTKEQIDAMVEPLDSSISTLTAQVSTMGTSLSSISASVSSMASAKRDKTDRVWEYTQRTDTEMYGVQKFYIHNDTTGGEYDLEKFDSTNKVWSMYEGQATTTPPPTVKAYSYALFAVIDENNPHTFVDDDDVERQGWPFYRTSDTNNSWLILAGDYEYVVNATRRENTSLALDNEVAEKRDYDDLSWKYSMDKDPDRFGVQSFEVTYNMNRYSLNSFLSSGVDRIWMQGEAPHGDRFEIIATSAHDFTLRDKITAKTTNFTRTNDTNTSWELQNGQDIYIVLASRRQPGRLALYEPVVTNSSEVILDFGQSIPGLILGANVSASTQAFIQINDVLLTGENYVSSRGMATRGMAKRDGEVSHLKVNGQTVAFTSEVEAIGSQVGDVASQMSAVTASVSTMASSVSELASTVGGYDSRISTVESSVSSFSSQIASLSSSVASLKSSYTDHETRIRDVEKKATGAREYMDLTYPTVNTNAQDGFGVDGFSIVFPAYSGSTAAAAYLSFSSVDASGRAVWYDSYTNLEVRGSDVAALSFYNNGYWGDLPISKNPTKVWAFYRNGGIRPATITPSFKSQTMKSIALTEYVDAQTSQFTSQIDALSSQVSALASTVGGYDSQISAMSGTVAMNTSAIQSNASAIA